MSKFYIWVMETVGYENDQRVSVYRYDETSFPTRWEAEHQAEYYSDVYDRETMGGYPRHCEFSVEEVVYE